MKHVLSQILWLDSFFQFYVDSISHFILVKLNIPIKIQRYAAYTIFIVSYLFFALSLSDIIPLSILIPITLLFVLGYLFIQRRVFKEDESSENSSQTMYNKKRIVESILYKLMGFYFFIPLVFIPQSFFSKENFPQLAFYFSTILLGYVLATPNTPPKMKLPSAIKSDA